MTYIELINRFWQMNTEYTFSTSEIALYFKILDIANKLGWKEPLSLPSKRLYLEFDISKPTFFRARQRLHDVGLIKFETRGTRKAGLYWYHNFTNHDTNHDTNHEPIVIPIMNQSRDNHETLYKTKTRDRLDKNVDTNVSKFSSENIPFKKIVQAFNEICKSYPPVKQLTDNRKKHIRARYAKHHLNEIMTVFKKMEASSFLRGDNAHGWQASFDWVFKNEDNFIKVLEGKYDKEVHHETFKGRDKRSVEREAAELYKSPAGSGFTEDELSKTLYHSIGDDQ